LDTRLQSFSFRPPCDSVQRGVLPASSQHLVVEPGLQRLPDERLVGAPLQHLMCEFQGRPFLPRLNQDAADSLGEGERVVAGSIELRVGSAASPLGPAGGSCGRAPCSSEFCLEQRLPRASSRAARVARPHFLQLLSRPALSQVPGVRSRGVARAAAFASLAGPVLPRRLHASPRASRVGARQPKSGLPAPVRRRIPNAAKARERPKTSWRADRRDRRPSHLGPEFLCTCIRKGGPDDELSATQRFPPFESPPPVTTQCR